MDIVNHQAVADLNHLHSQEPQPQQESPPQPGNLADALEDDSSVFEDQDGAQAALQPAMSSAASHLTSSQTPATEKAAALRRVPEPGYFDGPIVETEVGAYGSSPECVTSPEEISHTGDELSAKTAGNVGRRPGSPPPRQPVQLSLPSPWAPGPKNFVTDKSIRSQQTRGVLGSALGPTRQHRSKSAGQEALKRLQKALPSLSMPTHLLPSLPASFLSNFTGDGKHGHGSGPMSGATRAPVSATLVHRPKNAHGPVGRTPVAVSRLTGTPPPLQTQSRPPALRRVTSDDSILYHSLSRTSSLGDDDRFQDVREMVNIRLMALRDSLPDVPNFKMPTLARLQAASRRSSISLNGFFSSSTDDNLGSRQRTIDREVPGTGSTSPPKVSSSIGLDGVLEELTGDIVVLGGYRGSVLRSAEPPHQQLWAPVKLGFNMRKANLEVGLDDEDEETMEERIVPDGMLKHIGPVDISRKLFKRLRSCDNARSGKLRVWDYGYDWRLSPAISSRRLREFLEGLPSNQPGVAPESRGALVIAHSLGGLMTRHVVNQRPDLFAGVLYAGVPQRCINILGPFRNGDAVLFNEKLLTAQVNFSIRTSFLLLPDDGFCFVDKEAGESYPVDFFNADDWVKWRLSPCVGQVLPPLTRDKQQVLSPLSSLFPNSLLKGNRSEKNTPDSIRNNEGRIIQSTVNEAAHRDRTIAPQLNDAGNHAGAAPLPESPPTSPPIPDHDRYLTYLRRTLTAVSKFRAELAHSSALESANAYPPHAVLYGKAIPTVYAAQVNGRDGIVRADAYDNLLFRSGDGVVLAQEAMLPAGYSLVRSGRVSTERGHLTMLGDLPAVGRALEALVRGRKKGIGLGIGDGGGGGSGGSGSVPNGDMAVNGGESQPALP